MSARRVAYVSLMFALSWCRYLCGICRTARLLRAIRRVVAVLVIALICVSSEIPSHPIHVFFVTLCSSRFFRAKNLAHDLWQDRYGLRARIWPQYCSWSKTIWSLKKQTCYPRLPLYVLSKTKNFWTILCQSRRRRSLACCCAIYDYWSHFEFPLAPGYSKTPSKSLGCTSKDGRDLIGGLVQCCLYFPSISVIACRPLFLCFNLLFEAVSSLDAPDPKA